MPRQSDKRSRLIKAAKQLFLEKGYNETTLADIAKVADVPLGNVYYYFKTKRDIGLAVITEYAQELDSLFATWNQLASVKARLQTFVTTGYQTLDETLHWGCAIGSLCQELSKTKDNLAEAAAKLLDKLISWNEQQFLALGKNDASRTLALQLVSHIQGLSLLTNTFKDQTIATGQQQNLMEWLEQV